MDPYPINAQHLGNSSPIVLQCVDAEILRRVESERTLLQMQLAQKCYRETALAQWHAQPGQGYFTHTANGVPFQFTHFLFEAVYQITFDPLFFRDSMIGLVVKGETPIFLERALLYSSKRGVYEGPPKNGKSRTVKLAPETISLLRQHQCAQNYLQQVNGDRWIETGYVFTRENGDRMNPDSITDWLNKFSAANQLPHIHPHAFRHTAASTMIANGVDLVTAANELGHANAVTTATIYSHQIATAKAKASEVRSAAFSHRKANIAAEEDIGE